MNHEELLSEFFESDACVEEKITKLLSLDIALCKRKSNFLSRTVLVQMAKGLGIASSNKKKEELVDSIFIFHHQLQLAQTATSTDREHRRGKGTFARLCNFLMRDPNS